MWENGILDTFRNDYRALLGAKSCALTRRRFWYQAVLGNRSGRYSNCHFRKIKKIAKVQKFSDRKQKIGNLSTFRHDYRVLLGAKSCALTRRRFWYQTMLCNRSGRCRNCHFRKIEKSQNCKKWPCTLKSNKIGHGRPNEAYDTNFSHRI